MKRIIKYRLLYSASVSYSAIKSAGNTSEARMKGVFSSQVALLEKRKGQRPLRDSFL
jgi:hypothetical protein